MFQQAEENERHHQNILDSQNVTSSSGNCTASVEESPETGGLGGKVSAALFIALGFLHML
jgi:hypothetical protein